ncbi:hypothetical protein HDV00_007607 [Rhizophlyctis rosea]|nr:hypothetical protein HDV00_007607 [Rhizophlyctis rosea]
MASSTNSKVFLITGTSSGMGHALALTALRRGHKVIATARNASKLSSLVKDGAHALQLDVTWREDRIQQAVDEAVKVYGRIDVLVNNAGMVIEGAIEEMSIAETTQVFQTNLHGPINLINALLPHFRSSHSGTILNIGSLAALSPIPGVAAYSAAKAALATYTEALAMEVKPFDIRAIVMELGYFKTELTVNRIIVEKQVEAYEEMRVGDLASKVAKMHAGNVDRAVDIIVDVATGTGVAEGREVPVRLPLGGSGVGMIRRLCEGNLKMLGAWEDVIRSTD